MPKSARRSNLAANTAVDAMAALLDGGWLDLYTGVQPVTGDTAVAGTLLASLQFGTPAFVAGVAGIALANPITSDPSAVAGGTPTWYRCTKADHVTPVQDGSVGSADVNLILSPLLIVIATPVSVSSFSLTEKKS